MVCVLQLLPSAQNTGVMPAMEAKLAPHQWKIGDLITP